MSNKSSALVGISDNYTVSQKQDDVYHNLGECSQLFQFLLPHLPINLLYVRYKDFHFTVGLSVIAYVIKFYFKTNLIRLHD